MAIYNEAGCGGSKQDACGDEKLTNQLGWPKRSCAGRNIAVENANQDQSVMRIDGLTVTC